MATEQELADLERMSSDYVPDAKVIDTSYLAGNISLIINPSGASRWRTTINPGIGG